jgi:peptidyl-prolyl cis-trans isomerase SurA
MKKLVLVFLGFLFTCFSFAQTLFTYGNHQVSAAEFLNAYNKNKTDSVTTSKALREYLDLYINFKLKVQAAKDLHLDTLPSLIADLQNFRDQVKKNYLTDTNEIQRLEDEAFERGQKDIHSIFYFINTSAEKDSSKAFEKVNHLSELLNSAKKDAEVIQAFNASHQMQAQKQDLGYITVFTLPYQFENVVYSLKPGQVSKPYPARNGYFIFKNVGERHAVGKITVAQILLAVPAGESAVKIKQKLLADSIYGALQNGSDFEELAKKYSDDRNTFMNGGLMPEFGTAKYDSSFENHAFALGHDGQISAPFETEFGYHILKRISAAPVPASKDNENYLYSLKQQVLSDSREQIARKKFITEIRPVVGLKSEAVKKSDLWKVTDSALLQNKPIISGSVNKSTVLFTFNNGQKVKVADWLLYLKSVNRDWGKDAEKAYQQLWPVFIDEYSVENYASRLEKYNSAFKAQIDEFRDGNLLFEIMQRKIWNKASSDTIALKQYFNDHKNKYTWSASADAVIYSCSSAEVAKKLIAEIKRGRNWREIVNENGSTVQADSGRFELGQIPVVERTAFDEGLITLPVINKNDGTAVFAKIIKLYPGDQQRNFDDAKGLVINDYQNYLEQQWVAKLKKKYPVKVNEKVFQSLLGSH